jgi:hypothetical protein
MAASKRSGTILSTSGSGTHGCSKEIRNYALNIQFRYSRLPQGYHELSSLNLVQVFMAASRRSESICSSSDSGCCSNLKEIRNYPLYFWFRHSQLSEGDHELSALLYIIRFRYSWLPQGDQELSSQHPVQVFMAALRIS